MHLDLTFVFEGGSATGRAPAWVRDLETILAGLGPLDGAEGEMQIRYAGKADATAESTNILFIDLNLPGLDDVLASVDRRRRAVFLVTGEGERELEVARRALNAGSVDDVLIHPFRALEVQGKLRHYRQILMWDEVTRLNDSFGGLIERLHEDLQLAERLQKNRFPERFPETKGFRVLSRYVAGLKSGGDYFDLADSGPSGPHGRLSLVMTDSSSYGLSSAVLSALMRVAMKLNADDTRTSSILVRRIYSDLLAALKERDHLSMFYGVISRKDLVLNYVNLGTTAAFHARKDGVFAALEHTGGPITRAEGTPKGGDLNLELRPDDRLIVVSDGITEVLGGVDKTLELVNSFRERDSKDLLNELMFRVKKDLGEEDLPAQDCSAIVLDVDARAMRLASV